ncbi:MAG: ribosome biogenesis GTPase Der [Gemmataceae bacterium]
MPVPQVAIVGRPNVGKSSLFNWIAGRRIAIVDPTAGVTRDRVSTLVHMEPRYFELVDTGGIGIKDHDNLTNQVEAQIQTAIDQAAIVLFVVDGRSGLVPLDEEVAQRLRGCPQPILFVANKCDAVEMDALATDFARLGFGPALPVSAQQNRNKKELLELIKKKLPAESKEPPAQDPIMKLAIVGRRNTGKSTFINCLAEGDRVIVSEVPGTTRDSIDVRFEHDGMTFLAIDTAGVRKKKSVKGDIEFYSMARAERSIRRADVVMLFFDAALKISQVDKKLAEYILMHHKPAIFVVNKWDLLKQDLATSEFGDYLHKTFPSLDFVPVAFITAKTGRNVQPVLNLARNLHKQAQARVSTGELNRVVRFALETNPPPMRQNRRPKVYFATQVATQPPTIVLFTNGPDLFDLPYQRYMLKTFRDNLPFNDVPIKLYLRHRQGEGDEEEEEGEESPTPVKGKRKAGPAPAKGPRKGKAKPRGKKKRDELWRD